MTCYTLDLMQMIESRQAKNEALLTQQGRMRLLLDDDQRRLLLVNANAIGRRTLRELTRIVARDTPPRWHRPLVAHKFDTH